MIIGPYKLLPCSNSCWVYLGGSWPSFAREIVWDLKSWRCAIKSVSLSARMWGRDWAAGIGALGFSAPGLVRVGDGGGDREAGDHRPMASGRIPALLAFSFHAQGEGQTPRLASSFVNSSRAWRRRSHLGISQNPRRATEIGLGNFRAHGFAVSCSSGP